MFWETRKPLPIQCIRWWEGLLPSRLRESNPRPIHSDDPWTRADMKAYESCSDDRLTWGDERIVRDSRIVNGYTDFAAKRIVNASPPNRQALPDLSSLSSIPAP